MSHKPFALVDSYGLGPFRTAFEGVRPRVLKTSTTVPARLPFIKSVILLNIIIVNIRVVMLIYLS